MAETTKRKPGRAPISPSGKRIVFHLSISPEAHQALKKLCDRPVSPISMAAMIEHLIVAASKKN